MNSKYIRLSELVSLHHPEDKRSRFYKFWESFYEIPERVQAFSLIEKELSALDDKSWCFLKDEAKELCVKSDERRGWNQLFEKLNEAKGYCFLKLIGCSDIRFIPRATKNNIETPDLVGWRNTSEALCEVKTINISDDLVSARINISVMSAQNELIAGLTNKFESTITKAASQLNSYSKSPDTEKYIYLVIAYDDDLDYRNELNTQTRELFNAMNLVGIDLVIHNEA
jgi:ribosome-binding factor A